jgi:hypothetical protein
MRFCLTLLSILVTYFVCAGCSTQKTEQKIIAVESSVEPTSDGILITRFEIQPNDGSLREALLAFGEPVESQETNIQLENEGLHVRHVESIDLPAITSSIGTVEDQSYVWHGQILHWRDLEQRQIPKEGMLISEQGFFNFIDRGYLSLLARSWPVQREDGLFIYLQLLPSWHIPSGNAIVVGRGTLPLQSKLFPNLGFEALLQEGEAILIAASLYPPDSMEGPQDAGPRSVRLGEALFGGPSKADRVVLLVVESNILPRE